MKLKTPSYTIKLEDSESFDANSKDNIEVYDLEYHSDYESRPSSRHVIRVFANDTEIKSAIVCATGGATRIHEKSAVVSDNRLYLCCSNYVFCFKIPTLELLWSKQLDSVTCFEIHPYKGDFLIHGELEASRIDEYGNVIWSCSARDIFVSSDSSVCFKIVGNEIHPRDWQGNKYILNEDGKTIYA